MRIIHFHPDARMAMIFIAPLIDAERRAGMQSELVFSSVQNSGIEGTSIPFDLSGPNLLGLPLTLWRIWRYLKRRRPDVMFSHNTKSSLIPLLGAWLAGVHVRVYFNHGVPYVGYQGILRVMLRALEQCNSALATHVVTVSEDMKMLLQEVSPRITPQIIHNGSASGIDLHKFSSECYSRTGWRQALGLLENDLMLTKYLDTYESALTDVDVSALTQLFELGDNELLDLLLARIEPVGVLDRPAVHAVLANIRAL